MHTMLRIDASARTRMSRSRELGDYVEKVWTERNPAGRIVRRDLVADPIPHIVDETITGFYTPEAELSAALRAATALSDRLIEEVCSADAVLITVPMYNFSIPSALKAWIDQIVRSGRTFSFDGKNFAGLLSGKRAYIACAYGAGGYGAGGPLSAADYLRPYLTFLLNFLGIQDVHFFSIESTVADEAAAAADGIEAKRDIDQAVAMT